MLNALLVVSTLLTQIQGNPEAQVSGAPPTQVVGQPEAPVCEEPPKWEVFFGALGGLRPDAIGGGGGGLIGVNRRLTSWLRPELSLGLGLYAGPGDVVTLIRIGTRLEWPSDARLKPYVWLAFAHNHEVAFESAAQHPVSSVLGLSEDGVNHRSGLDTGLGLSMDFPHRKDSRFGGRLNVRASLTHLLGLGPPRYLDLTMSIGLIF